MKNPLTSRRTKNAGRLARARQRLPAAEGVPEDRHRDNRRVDYVSEQDRRPEQDGKNWEDDEVRDRGKDGVPDADRDDRAQMAQLEQRAAVEDHVLDEPVRPAAQLRAQEVERVRGSIG